MGQQNKLPNNQNWMRYVDDNKLLSELTIPGTHDTGTFQVIDIGPAKCQTLKLSEQLDAGIRYLDIRVKRGHDDDGVLWLYHGVVPLNITFSQVADYCYQFLEAHPKETILMSVKDEKEGDDKIAGWVEAIINLRKDKWYLANDRNPKLKDVRGKIVLFRRFDYADIGLDSQGGWPKDSTGNFSHHGINFHVQDNYYSWSEGISKADKFDIWVKNCLIAAATGAPNTFFINFTSATGITAGVLPFSSNPWDLAQTVVPLLYDYLNANPLRRYGIVPMDFPEIRQYLIKTLIDCNYNDPLQLPRTRNRSTGAVYLSFDEQLHHVPDPAVAERIFGSNWDLQAVPNFDFTPASEGTPLTDSLILKFGDRPNLYLCYGEQGQSKATIRHIADPATRAAFGLLGSYSLLGLDEFGNYIEKSPLQVNLV